MNPNLKILALEAEARSNVFQQTLINYHSARYALEQQKKGVEELKHQVDVQRIELSECMAKLNLEVEKEQSKAKLANLGIPRA